MLCTMRTPAWKAGDWQGPKQQLETKNLARTAAAVLSLLPFVSPESAVARAWFQTLCLPPLPLTFGSYVGPLLCPYSSHVYTTKYAFTVLSLCSRSHCTTPTSDLDLEHSRRHENISERWYSPHRTQFCCWASFEAREISSPNFPHCLRGARGRVSSRKRTFLWLMHFFWLVFSSGVLDRYIELYIY